MYGIPQLRLSQTTIKAYIRLPVSNPHHKNSSGAKPFVSKSAPYSIFALYSRKYASLRHICVIFAS